MKYLMRILILIIACCFSCLAYGGELVVVVSAGSNADALTREQVINIFLGRYRQFPSGQTAVPFDLVDGGAMRSRFYRLLVDKDVAEINAYWARLLFSGKALPPQAVGNTTGLFQHILSRRGAIGYMERSQVDSRFTIVYSLEI
jgi:ABC-type phosphate transport system substrate-binding protein